MTKVYASGETPAVGDVVRRTKEGGKSAGVGPGDVITVADIGVVLQMSILNKDHYVNFFTLIARAGDPVILQPGDVVERVAPGTGGTGAQGKRYTVKNAIAEYGRRYIYSHCGAVTGAGYAGDDYDGNFRLVHRPDAPAAVEPTLTTAQIADTLRPGDKVRFTVEAVIGQSLEGEYWMFTEDEINSGTIEILSRAAPCPPAGKLTSTDDLLPGDILVCTTPGLGLFGEQVTVKGVESASLIRTSEGLYHPSHFAFVRRPQ